MPVLDHPVHEKVRVDAGHRYGCLVALVVLLSAALATAALVWSTAAAASDHADQRWTGVLDEVRYYKEAAERTLVACIAGGVISIDGEAFSCRAYSLGVFRKEFE